MGGSKGKSIPVDGTKWLQAFQKEITWGEPHRWRLEELKILRMELRTFFSDVEKTQIPRNKLKRIKQVRSRMARDLYSPGLLKQMERELDGQEIRLYQYLLGAEHYGAVTETIPLVASATEWTSGGRKEFILKLREAFSMLPDSAKRLRTPIGKKLLAGSQKIDGQSWKSSAIVAAYILNVYDLFKLFYRVSGRGLSITKPLEAGGQYPFPLIKDIGDFFRKEFSPWLDDLTDQDIISRIQYGHSRKVQRTMYLPNKLNID